MTAFPPEHPASERGAAWFHATLAGWYLMGLWFHAVSAWRHFKARDKDA